jgi:hypothetical protein
MLILNKQEQLCCSSDRDIFTETCQHMTMPGLISEGQSHSQESLDLGVGVGVCVVVCVGVGVGVAWA